ncbi:hypothetical protein PV328_010697 [Microctonus aethiopoides]|uniref:Mitochondrial cardiolipin hydrolase n=1 Tax=Microctonus aethiopoides TaxID=144406 RepID=A0AA39FI97_9HYME|nr:hypothetical protein PV328_010697 [Microctonus aethiopoides]
MAIRLVTMLGVGLIGTEIIWQLWKRIGRNHKLASRQRTAISEVFIFSDECSHCRNHANTRIPCNKNCPVASIKRLIHYLDASHSTLDVCIYIMTSQDITKAIIEAQRRKVLVRVIVDANMSENSACFYQLELLKRNGVRVRMQRSNVSLMHHKFALIDNEIMIYGSTNWTMQAFYGNFDGILVTNQHEFVKPFINEFNRMWEELNFEEILLGN